ncbi:MAG: HAD-IIA family hydrolase [Pseudorhodobacter sp.]
MPDAAATFARYETIRPRLPSPGRPGAGRRIDGLLAMADHADAFVFDAFGVLNVGDALIPGADACLDALRAMGKQIRLLTNAASQPHAAAVAKFRRFGLHLDPAEIITSRDATLAALDERLWGCIALPGDGLTDIPGAALRLGEDPADFARAEGFLFLASAGWTPERQSLLAAALRDHPRPLRIANADLVAPRGDHLSLEPGWYGHAMLDAGPADVRFFGKPFPEVYQMAEATLPGTPPARIAMSGDTLHTDILGAQARGWQGVFVTADGLFAGHDPAPYIAACGIRPDWITARI